MSLRKTVARALAQAFLAGPWEFGALLAGGDFATSAGGTWLRELAFEVLRHFPRPPLHALEALADFIDVNASFRETWSERKMPHVVPRFVPFEPQMGARRWDVPVLTTHHELSSWLGITDEALLWFADRRGLERVVSEEPLRHYRRQWIDRGARQPRLLEAPRPKLKALQRRVLEGILSKLPVHDAAHGFVAGRSATTHARVHVGRAWVVRFDLEAFFTHVGVARALGVFTTAGYPWGVSRSLLGLCTTRTPEAVLRAAPYAQPATGESLNQRFHLQRALASWHLPQGAPTSPALANLTSFSLDARLQGYAEANGLVYSRYADDLVFSGDTKLRVGTLAQFVRTVAKDEGFRVNEGKTRVMRAHRRQEVTGVVVNAKPNVGRHEFDLLKAQLHRCRRDGPAPHADGDVAKLKARLQGQIAWVAQLSPSRGAKLRRTFDDVAW
jgi:hypothetical protein